MLTLAIDIDGTLDTYADFFQTSIPLWQKAGIRVGILTGRPEDDKEEVAGIIAKAGIHFDFLLFKPDAFNTFPNGVWKAVMCRLMKVDILFDDLQHDDPSYISDFAQVVGSTQIFTPVNYKIRPDGSGETIGGYVEELISALSDADKKRSA